MESYESPPLRPTPLWTEAQPDADQRRSLASRRWLEETWRHGEIMDDDEVLDQAPAPPNRFTIPIPDAASPVV